MRGCGDLVNTRGANSNLLLHDVAMRSTIGAAKLVGLGIDYADNAKLNLRRANTLLIEEIEKGLLVGFRFRVERSKVVASLLVVEGPDGEVGFYRALG